jgi:phosphoglucosamine mutase
VDLIDVGVIPTAGIAWLLRRLGLEAGAVISASHNPVEQNGIKFIDALGLKFNEALEAQIESLLDDEHFSSNLSSRMRLGHLTDGSSFHELYMEGLLDEHAPGFLGGIKLLVDCSNGAASAFAPQVFSRAGAEGIAIHSSPNGLNINHGCGSEFVRRSPWDMGKLIHQFNADFGLAFDGDADRVVFVDEDGNLIDGDHMLGFLARYLKQKYQLLADTVVTTQMRNSGLKTYLENSGFTIVETPVGDKYVVDKILALRQDFNSEGKFGLGGEQAGHIDIINDLFTTGDGIRTALYVLRAYLESGETTMNRFAASVGKTPQIIASAFVGNGKRFTRQVLFEMETSLKETNLGLERVNLRYSGTEPLFRVMIESDGQQTVQDLAKIAWVVCRQAQQYSKVQDGDIDILNCTNGGVITPD